MPVLPQRVAVLSRNEDVRQKLQESFMALAVDVQWLMPDETVSADCELLICEHPSKALLKNDIPWIALVADIRTAQQVLDCGAGGFLLTAQLDLPFVQMLLTRIQPLQHPPKNGNLLLLPEFLDRLQMSCNSVLISGRSVALICVDIREFGYINEVFGYRQGDHMLGQVAERLFSVIPDNAFISRMAGDQFLITVPDMKDRVRLNALLLWLQESIAMPFAVQDQECVLQSCIGYLIYPQTDVDANTLIRYVLDTVKQAKTGQRRVLAFGQGLTRLPDLTLDTEMVEGLAKQQFELYFQPKFDLHAGHVSGLEALVRWNHPKYGQIPPGEFIPRAEHTGFIQSLGLWILLKSCEAVAQMQVQGLRPPQIAVNLSFIQLRDREFYKKLSSMISRLEIDPHCIQLELTETSVMENLETAQAVLTDIHNQGVSIALDDFGTGFSSLTHIHSFPISTIKIDRSFIRQMLEKENSRHLVRSLINLAHDLSLTVVAEGVESTQQLDLLKQMHCDHVQGFLTGIPMPYNAMVQMLARQPKYDDLIRWSAVEPRA
ncbi:putative bifunctional diguanylate cyclase/phosphodiesterase [Gynuella sp.]|uniref:putative bifunctional diguanylate cyclase/phosphodiesterase n=1 Tax=Gynuella sp. TaxID=2969146 RepID=UPI003D0EC8FC